MVRLQFSYEHTPNEIVVAWGTHSQFSHVDVVLPDGTLLGARPIRGVQIRPAGYHSFVRTQVVELPCSQEQADTFYALLRAEIGKGYDFGAILGFVLGAHMSAAPARWMCSELVGTMLEKACLLPARLALPMDKLSPGDLLLLMSALAPVTKPV